MTLTYRDKESGHVPGHLFFVSPGIGTTSGTFVVKNAGAFLPLVPLFVNPTFLA